VKLLLTDTWEEQPETVTKTFKLPNGGNEKTVTVELFTWEKLDYVDQVKAAFGIYTFFSKKHL
jgi:hypothetical protein